MRGVGGIRHVEPQFAGISATWIVMQYTLEKTVKTIMLCDV